jgi:hypothetical protein
VDKKYFRVKFFIHADESLLPLFFFLKEKEAKRSKNPDGLTLYQCQQELERARLSPLVILLVPRKIRRNHEARCCFTDLLRLRGAL